MQHLKHCCSGNGFTPDPTRGRPPNLFVKAVKWVLSPGPGCSRVCVSWRLVNCTSPMGSEKVFPSVFSHSHVRFGAMQGMIGDAPLRRIRVRKEQPLRTH
mmetsp:Transcript_33790/g.56500  ORF Transcript_33790/g.56500 Transcript_33790/m.56500 type:complete len:100 (-) Transcript_33790:45-344(-)